MVRRATVSSRLPAPSASSSRRSRVRLTESSSASTPLSSYPMRPAATENSCSGIRVPTTGFRLATVSMRAIARW